MAKSNRAETGETAPNTVVYYSPTGGEYPVNEDTLSAAERTNLAAWGYSTTKPEVDPDVAEQVASNDAGAGAAGPLSGAADPPQ